VFQLSRAASAIGGSGIGRHLRPGYDADMLAIAGDPLSDPAALHAIRTVYVRGAAVTG
jgi:imidazolonepropionase-like amidohydrolase